MIFWKIDEETIRCLITKEEIDNMGFNLKSLTTDAEQMGEFLEAIVKSSRDYIDWHTENGIQNYAARSLPSDQLLVTISCTFQDVMIDRDLDQIKRMTNALNTKISQERLDQIYALSGEEKEQAFAQLSKDLHDVCVGNIDSEDKKEGNDSVSIPSGQNGIQQEETAKAPLTITPKKFMFAQLSDVIRFCSMLDKKFYLTSSLYKSEDSYLLLVDFDKCADDSEAVSFLIMAEEYGASCKELYYDKYYLKEHGQVIIEDNAVEVLSVMA